MAPAESQPLSLHDALYDDPEQLSQLLRQRAGSSDQPPPDFTVSTASNLSPARPPRAPLPPTLQLHPGRQTTRHVKPGLPTHHSAPTGIAHAMDRHALVRAVQSFAGAADSPGDTQPDSQIYRHFTSGLLGSHSHDSARIAPPAPAGYDHDADTPTNSTGAVPSSQEGPSQTVTSPTVVFDDDPETQMRAEPPPTSPLKFETPALAGRKRDSQGHVVTLSSAARTMTTPGTNLTMAAFFPAGAGNGNGVNDMSLTQIFNATQARTSPLAAPSNEDVVFQRPSPNFAAAARPSSPMQALSSPIKQLHSDSRLRSSSEPRAEYVTMKQSQDQRLRGLSKEIVEEEDSWERPGDAEMRLARRKAKEKLEREAGRSLGQVTAPVLTSPRRTQGRRLLVTSTSPKALHAPKRRPRRSAYDGPFDSDEDDDFPRDPRDPPNLDGAEELSPDELSPEVPASAHQTPNVSNPPRNIEVPNTSSHPRRTLSGQSRRPSPLPIPASLGASASQPQASASQPRARRPKSSKESVIMDSQPQATADQESMPRPKPLLLPSSPSSNQYSINQTTLGGRTGYTSQVVSSSMPPMPPKSVSPELDDNRENSPELGGTREEDMQSSPPAITDDLMYDEHDYEDHPSVREDEEPELHQSGQEDSDTGEEDPLISEEDDMILSGDKANAEEDLQTRSRERSTIPESDLVDDTEPSALASTDVIQKAAAESATGPSTAPFHTAREQQSAVVSNRDTDDDEEDNGSASHASPTASAGQSPQFRSLNDIANQPATQVTNELAELEIPQLSFTETADDDMDATATSPTRKKAKITYGAKKRAKASRPPLADLDQLPSSPLKPTQTVLEKSAPVDVTRRVPSRKDAPNASKVDTSKPGKKGALKPVNKALLLGSSPSTTRKTSRRAAASPSPSSEPAEDAVSEADDQGPMIAESAEPIEEVQTTSDRGEPPTGPLLVPKRIIAPWPGKPFYPATCINRVDPLHLLVRYDDGTTNTVDAASVRTFDLRIGDHVKVEMAGMKKNVYVVVGFKDKIEPGHSVEFPLTDRHGYATVVLEVKQRDSVSHVQEANDEETIAVPLKDIYFTKSLWGKLYDRRYEDPDTAISSATASRVVIPAAERTMSPSKTRRSIVGSSLLKQSVRRGSVTPSVHSSSGSIFSNMAFAITLGQDYDQRDSIMSTIASNGGTVMEGSFDDMFQISEGIALKSKYQGLRFVALIADEQSRSTKYMQALALNLPCLHHRWLTDSIAASTALSFGRYLLPAGTSKYLNPRGVIRSRTMRIYDPSAEDVPTFNEVVDSRDPLLAGHSVLLVTQRKQNTPFAFLIQALGPKTIGHCTDVDAALTSIRRNTWDWIYIGEGISDDKGVFGKPASSADKKGAARGRKRKKEDREAELQPLVSGVEVGGKMVRVVRDEFVLQSLILGALVGDVG